jgi:hypothetical protein
MNITRCLITPDIAARRLKDLLGTDMPVKADQITHESTDAMWMTFRVSSGWRTNNLTVPMPPSALLLSLDDFEREYLKPAVQDHGDGLLQFP